MFRLKPDEPSVTPPLRHVYLLSYHRPNADGILCVMFVGVYSSLIEVEKAKARLRSRPGFRELPDGFRVDGKMLDVEYDDPRFFAAVGPLPPNELDNPPTEPPF